MNNINIKSFKQLKSKQIKYTALGVSSVRKDKHMLCKLRVGQNETLNSCSQEKVTYLEFWMLIVNLTYEILLFFLNPSFNHRPLPPAPTPVLVLYSLSRYISEEYRGSRNVF